MVARVEERNQLPSDKAGGSCNEDFLSRHVLECFVALYVPCQPNTSCIEHSINSLSNASTCHQAAEATERHAVFHSVFNPACAIFIRDEGVNV
jgi:hypothetical protein